MDSLQVYDHHADENEEPEEESQKTQPDFSVNEVEIQEVSVVVETQELVAEEVKYSANEEEDNLAFTEGRNSPVNKVLNRFEKAGEESVNPSSVPEAEEGLHAPNAEDQVRKLVDLNRETCEAGMISSALEGDIVMTEDNVVAIETDPNAMENADQGTGMLQRTESEVEHDLAVDGVPSNHQAADIEVDDQQPPLERAPTPRAAASDDGSAGQDPEEVPADLVGKEVIVDKDTLEKQTTASEHAQTEREGSLLNPENVNDGDNHNAQAGTASASQENPNVEEGLESASGPKQPFNDANLAQLRAQILVMGILRKGSSPSDDLMKSACPASVEGTPTVTVSEDIDNAATGSPSFSRKRKSRDKQILSSGNNGIATDLMNAVKDNLHLPQSEDASLLDDTDRQLCLAQASAHDAMATATSALAQSHLAWAQIRCEDHSETGIARETQIASVAATVAAAASVAQAAVEAAKAIANVSRKTFAQGGQVANGLSSATQSKRPGKSSLAMNRKSDMLDSVLKAAGMAAEAATQAGTVLAFANPLMHEGGMEAPWTRTAGEGNETENKATRAGSRKSKATSKKAATKTTFQKKAAKKSASPKTTQLKVQKDVFKKNNLAARGKAVKEDTSRRKTRPSKAPRDSRHPAPLAKSTEPDSDLVGAGDSGEINEKSEFIVRGSVVEIMTEEVGLRGGWFSGKVLKMAKGQAFVVYDEILNDDGTPLEEWFPFKASGDPAGSRRQVRPVHPYSSIREAGSKKRRRVAMGSQTWTIGDHVDAFTQDAWWEGILLELNDIDESKATVYFPGENDTQIVKVWDLRPSLQWEDGKWVPWVNSTVIEQNERHRTRGKDDSSSSKVKKDKPVKADVPKVTSKVKNARKSSGKTEPPRHEVDESVSPRSTRKGKAEDSSARATRATKSPKKSGGLCDQVDESIPTRSTRQGSFQEISTKASKAKNSSKDLEAPIKEVNQPSPSRSSRKRTSLELSAETKKGKKNPRVLEDPIIEPISARSTRSSPGGKKLDEMTMARDNSEKKSTTKAPEKKNPGGKNTKISNKLPQDISTAGVPKKLDLNVDTAVRTTRRRETLRVTATQTRGKLKAEEATKRTRRR